jgi:hypothetical protein
VCEVISKEGKKRGDGLRAIDAFRDAADRSKWVSPSDFSIPTSPAIVY